MAKTLIPVDGVSENGVVFDVDTAAQTTDGNYFLNNGNDVLFAKNTGGASVNVDVFYAADKYGRGSGQYKRHAVAAGQTKMIGPLPKHVYNQPGEYVDVKASAACFFAVIRA